MACTPPSSAIAVTDVFIEAASPIVRDILEDDAADPEPTVYLIDPTISPTFAVPKNPTFSDTNKILD